MIYWYLFNPPSMFVCLFVCSLKKASNAITFFLSSINFFLLKFHKKYSLEIKKKKKKHDRKKMIHNDNKIC